MQGDESYQRFTRQVSRRAKEFKESMDAMLVGFSSDSSEARKRSAISLAYSAQCLGELLAPQDWPNWLEPIYTAANVYGESTSEPNAKSLLVEIIKHFSSVRPHRVLEHVSSESPYNFDSYYEEARAAVRMPELFDSHVQAITAIIESEEVESVTVLNALIQLVATLKANRDGYRPTNSVRASSAALRRCE